MCSIKFKTFMNKKDNTTFEKSFFLRFVLSFPISFATVFLCQVHFKSFQPKMCWYKAKKTSNETGFKQRFVRNVRTKCRQIRRHYILLLFP